MDIQCNELVTLQINEHPTKVKFKKYINFDDILHEKKGKENYEVQL